MRKIFLEILSILRFSSVLYAFWGKMSTHESSILILDSWVKQGDICHEFYKIIRMKLVQQSTAASLIQRLLSVSPDSFQLCFNVFL